MFFSSPGEFQLWRHLLGAKFSAKDNDRSHRQRRTWDSLLGSLSGLSDIPCICFAEELREVYPEAKVILVSRDLESWKQSFISVVGTVMNDRKMVWLAWYVRHLAPVLIHRP